MDDADLLERHRTGQDMVFREQLQILKVVTDHHRSQRKKDGAWGHYGKVTDINERGRNK